MSNDHPMLDRLKKPMMRLVKNPLDVDRPATAAEIRAANAMLAEITSASGGGAVMDGFSVLTPLNQRRILMQVRAIIWSLKHVADDAEIWDAFAGDDVMWKDRTSQGVFLRYLDLASPMDKSTN